MWRTFVFIKSFESTSCQKEGGCTKRFVPASNCCIILFSFIKQKFHKRQVSLIALRRVYPDLLPIIVRFASSSNSKMPEVVHVHFRIVESKLITSASTLTPSITELTKAKLATFFQQVPAKYLGILHYSLLTLQSAVPYCPDYVFSQYHSGVSHLCMVESFLYVFKRILLFSNCASCTSICGSCIIHLSTCVFISISI